MIKTFWETIEDFKIEIPVIQRDYAQGRDNPKIKAIRKDLVNDLVCYLVSVEEKKFHLDFVYGKTFLESEIEESQRKRENIGQLLTIVQKYSEDQNFRIEYKLTEQSNGNSANKTLVPLDGQQRLTTLFLLYFFIGAVTGQDVTPLLNFRYKTRKSSNAFCKKLIEQATHFKGLSIKGLSIKISDYITNQNWYHLAWKNDPTIAGMLVVLDEIQGRFRHDFDLVSTAWKNLTINRRITFDFFDLDQYNLSDELYIKMNARGKPLNDFENLKAWIPEQRTIHNMKLKKDWEYKIDKEWLDMFWHFDSNISTIDINLLSFFKQLAMFKKIEAFNNASNLSLDEKEIIEKLNGKDFIPEKYYEEQNIFGEESLNYIFTILDALSHPTKREELVNFVDTIWSPTFREENSLNPAVLKGLIELNLFHKTFIYALFCFLNLKGKALDLFDKEDWKKFGDWLRIARNLIYNSRIDDDSSFSNAINAINKLGNHILDIDQHMQSGSDEEWIDFFTKTQKKEEHFKLKFLSDPEWCSRITVAENHHYFYGQVQFLFDYSKDLSGNYDKQKFDENFKRLSNLFSKAHLDRHDFLIQNALFCFSDKWMPEHGSDRFSFVRSTRSNARERDENWRSVLKEDQYNSVVKQLIGNCDCSTASLIDLIEMKKPAILDWRRIILDQPEIITVCGQRLIKWENDGSFIRLLGQSKLSHYHRELRSYALLLQINSGNYNLRVEDHPVKTGGERPCIKVKGKHAGCYIKFDEDEKAFVYKTKSSDEFVLIDNGMDEISADLYQIVNGFKTYIE